MLVWLKLSFFSLFLLSANYYFYQNVVTILKNPNFVYSVDLETLYPIIYLAFSLYILSIAFSFVATLFPKNYLKIGLILLTSLTPFLFFPRIEFALGIAFTQSVVLLLSMWDVQNHLKNYFNFNPRLVFSGSLHSLTNLLAILVAGIFFFSYSQYIDNHGFEIPEEVTREISSYTVNNVMSQLTQTPGSEDLSKLKQFGLNEAAIKKVQKDFSGEDVKTQLTTILSKQLQSTIKDLIKPYLGYVPIVTTVLVYVTLASVVGLGFFLVPLLLSLIYMLLEKANIVKFESRTQIVKRLVIEDSNKKVSGQ